MFCGKIELTSKQTLLKKIYIIWYNENNGEMKTDSVTTKDRHVINSSPLVDTKYQNPNLSYMIIYYFMINISYSKFHIKFYCGWIWKAYLLL